LSEDAKKAIKDADFIFENSMVKVVANRNNPAIELPEMTVGPFTEGKESNPNGRPDRFNEP
jgi:hypothetical protein